MNTSAYSGQLDFAEGLAREAGALMRKNFSLGMKKEWKSDMTPLTATDVAVNELVLRKVQGAYPADAIISEEGSAMKDAEYAWVCDPVDGTMPFSHGLPTFVFSLALTKRGESVAAVVYDPICDRMVRSEKGQGAFVNGQRMQVASDEKLGKMTMVETGGFSVMPSLQAVIAATGSRVLTFYSCVYAGMLVASGELVAAIYKHTSPWDAAAVKSMVEEAGGRVTSLSGKEQRYDREVDGFVASNGLIHDELLALVAPLR